MLQVKRNANDPFSVQVSTHKKKEKLFSASPWGSCGKTEITNNNKRKPKIKYTTKKPKKIRTWEKQENVEEKSKRLNFNAAISLAWRVGVFGLLHGKACQAGVQGATDCTGYRAQGVFSEFDSASDAWQTCWLVIDVSSFSREHTEYFFLKPFYKCLQCCVICN